MLSSIILVSLLVWGEPRCATHDPLQTNKRSSGRALRDSEASAELYMRQRPLRSGPARRLCLWPLRDPLKRRTVQCTRPSRKMCHLPMHGSNNFHKPSWVFDHGRRKIGDKLHPKREGPQKSASNEKPLASSLPADMTPAFWYSPTRFSKKFVVPCNEINSIQSNGFDAMKILLWPKAVSKRSATNSMYFTMRSLFMPIKSQGKASQMKRRSASTAPRTIPCPC